MRHSLKKIPALKPEGAIHLTIDTWEHVLVRKMDLLKDETHSCEVLVGGGHPKSRTIPVLGMCVTAFSLTHYSPASARQVGQIFTRSIAFFASYLLGYLPWNKTLAF